MLKVRILDNTLFRSSVTKKFLDLSTAKYQIEMQPQMPIGDSTDALLSGANNFKAGMDGLVIGNFLMNMLLSGSLNSLWTLVNTL